LSTSSLRQGSTFFRPDTTTSQPSRWHSPTTAEPDPTGASHKLTSSSLAQRPSVWPARSPVGPVSFHTLGGSLRAIRAGQGRGRTRLVEMFRLRPWKAGFERCLLAATRVRDRSSAVSSPNWSPPERCLPERCHPKGRHVLAGPPSSPIGLALDPR
jgi:hypothetical protein